MHSRAGGTVGCPKAQTRYASPTSLPCAAPFESVRRLVGAKRVAPIPDEFFPLAAPLVSSRRHIEYRAAMYALVDEDEAPARAQGNEVVLQVQRKVIDVDPDTSHVVLL